jgi:1-acyl-sn-glycerol-3-phosphate acyltransferase
MEIRVTGHPIDPEAQLLISNHISFLDVMSFFLLTPSMRLVSADFTRRIFLVGKLLDRCGAIWINRGLQTSRTSVRKVMRETWRDGGQVGICPAGKVSNKGMPFHPGSFQEAVAAHIVVQGVKLTYDPSFLAQVKDGSMESRLLWVLSQNIVINVNVLQSETAKGDPMELCTKWEHLINC